MAPFRRRRERLGTYSAPVPAPPVELFFRNYELRITGIDRIFRQDVPCGGVVVRAEERPLFPYASTRRRV